jgi:hypothetical protein
VVENSQNPVDLQDVERRLDLLYNTSAPLAHVGSLRRRGLSLVMTTGALSSPVVSLAPPHSPLSRISTRMSISTVATAVPRLVVIELSLSDLCKYIGDHRSLQEAEIISTECYAQNLGGVTHRFLLFELRGRIGRTCC